MNLPKGFYIIHQPKYRIPGVVDLNQRGLFKFRPFVTSSWIYRIIASKELQVKLQYLNLVEKEGTDPETGYVYKFAVENHLMDLDVNLAIQPDDLAASVPDQSVRENILAGLEEFRTAYIPVDKHKKIDGEGLKKKLLSSIGDRKEMIRKELVNKNGAWVNAAIPRLIQNFRRSFYLKVGDRLFEHYHKMGGGISEDELIRKINQFQRVYENNDDNLMQKPDGGLWKDEDEIWECWVGFAGGEEEAKRICRTMNAVFRPLADEMADQTSINR